MLANIYGPPCGGKSTICTRLQAEHGIRYISVGEITYQEANTGSELGNAILRNRITREPFPQGFLLPLIRSSLQGAGVDSIILDGYPRHMSELDEAIGLYQDLRLEIRHILAIDTPAEVCRQRMLHRLTCSACYASFSRESAKAIACPACGATGPLISRGDDNDQRFVERFRNYEMWTPNVMQALSSYCRVPVITIDGTNIDKAVREVWLLTR